MVTQTQAMEKLSFALDALEAPIALSGPFALDPAA